MKKIIMLLILISLIISCSNDREDKLVIGLIKPALNHLTFDFSLAVNFLERENYIIKYFSSGWETNEALVSGKIDVAILPFTYSWLDVSNGKDVKIISFLERESDGIVARPEIKTLEQMQGKKLGVLRGSTLDVFAEMMVENKNMNMEFVYFRTPMDMASALKAAEVDALSFYVPSIFKFSSDYNILHWYGDDHPLHTCCNISATQTAIDDKLEMIKQFLTGLKMGTDELNKSPDTAYKAMEEFYELYPPYSKHSLYHTKYVMNLEENMKEFELRAFNKMLEKGYAENPVKPQDVYFEIK